VPTGTAFQADDHVIRGADGDIRSSKQGGGAFAEGTLCTVRLLLAFCQHFAVGKAQHPKTRPAHLIFTVQGVEAKTLLTSLIHFAACFTVSLCTFIYCIYVYYILIIDY